MNSKKVSRSKYKTAGVDILAGDAASSLAGKWAATTFPTRANKIGKPVRLPGGYAGALDFGTHYIVTCDDGTGTKMAVAERMQKFSTLGSDLVAMVADDAVCLGAEVISISNTLDCPRVEKKVVNELLRGLALECRKQKIVIPGGEIAEVGKTVNGLVWNATAIGIVEKKKIIDGSRIRPGDQVLALYESGLRSNGFSLARHILKKKFGKKWHEEKSKVKSQKSKVAVTHDSQNVASKTWGELLLTPSTVYHAAILNLIGRYGEKPRIAVHGIAHVTGGGIPGNLPRIFRDKKLGAKLPNLWEPSAWVRELIRLGRVSTAEAREVWCLGNGMLVVVAPRDAERTIHLLQKSGVQARVAGEITRTGKIEMGNERVIKSYSSPLVFRKNCLEIPPPSEDK